MWPFRKKTHFRVLLILGGIILIFGVLFGVARVNDYWQVRKLVKVSDELVKQEKYQDAFNNLSSTQTRWSTTRVRQEIETKMGLVRQLLADQSNYERGNDLFGQSKWPEAKDSYSKISKAYPHYPDAQDKIKQCQSKINEANASAEQQKQSTAKTTIPEPKISAPDNSPNALPYTVPVYTFSLSKYYYVGGSQYADASGASVSLTQAQPDVTGQAGYGNNHSAIELVVGSADGKQYIEIGWTMHERGLIGVKDSPQLFVGAWVNGQALYVDPTLWCDECAFVRTSTTHTPGEKVAVDSTGDYGINYADGKWWIYYNGDTLGYFPESLWSGNFTRAGLINVYGEVATLADSTGGIQMGNGILGSLTGSARISNFKLKDSSSTPALRPYKTVPSNYDYGSVTADGLNLGGPG